jgi:alpha-ketoglutarate-dependent taurine dioxygenase
MKVTVEPAKPLVGGIVHVDKARLLDDDVVETIRSALEERGVLVFPRINVSDQEQLALTDRMGGRANIGGKVPGAHAETPDVYKITLDKKINTEPDYVLGTFFWHVDGVPVDQPLPKATMLSARHLSSEGGSTEFANLYAAYERLPEEEKRELEGMRVIHTVEGAVRPVYGRLSKEREDRYANLAPGMERPLVWTHADGRKSILIGTHAEGIVGMPGAHARALLTRLQQWASQPEFVYRHSWQVGDLVIWDNQGVMHRVVPYSDEGRVMHRTVIAGTEEPGHRATEEQLAHLYEPT